MVREILSCGQENIPAALFSRPHTVTFRVQQPMQSLTCQRLRGGWNGHPHHPIPTTHDAAGCRKSRSLSSSPFHPLPRPHYIMCLDWQGRELLMPDSGPSPCLALHTSTHGMPPQSLQGLPDSGGRDWQEERGGVTPLPAFCNSSAGVWGF